MRTSILSAVAATMIVFAASGSRVCVAQTPNYQGVWTGMTMSSSSLGSAVIEADINQSGSTLSGAARITQGTESYTGTITGAVSTPASVTINFGAFGIMAAALYANGSNVIGTYSLTAGSDPAIGSLALTLEPGVTTPNISGLWIGTSLNSQTGGTSEGSGIVAMQTGNSIFFSTEWAGDDIYNGMGTIIGNKIVFQVTQTDFIDGTAKTMSGTATVNGKAISGLIAIGPAGSGPGVIGAFTVSFVMPLM